MHHARATLREMGYRLTPQRVMVWEALRNSRQHLTAEQVFDRVRTTVPEVNLSTVYRTLELLVKLDLVAETKLGTATTFYEVEDGTAHHHYVCERCGTVGHFEDRLFAPVYSELRAVSGFDPSHSHATVFGICESCREKTAHTINGSLHAHP